MLFSWLRSRRRAEILETPFPEPWRRTLANCVGPWARWDDDARKRLEDLVQVFVAEKNFEGCGGLELTDEMKVIIAGQACVLIWGHDDHDLYRGVESILVYPSAVVPRRTGGGIFPREREHDLHPVLGEAHLGGPVVLAWDATLHGAKIADDGANLVFHEFAHKLDMLTGSADGTPPIESRAQRAMWARACEAEFVRLREAADHGKRTLLDTYGAVNEAEFFAVATELFFERPDAMKLETPALYAALSGFYCQDLAR